MIKYFWKSIVWGLFILIICGIPGDELSKFKIVTLPYLDKVVHLTLYYIFTIFLYSAFIHRNEELRKNAKPFLYGSLIALSYGIAIELLQLYVFSHRSFELLDIAANALGVFAALVSYAAIHRLTEEVL
ncbi:MAG TPA: VanZ family protein [Williamwhitmania sp.]|nr:VanZ family protein [Williamwhitmania sp.]